MEKCRFTRIDVDDDFTNGNRKGIDVLETDPPSNVGLWINAVVLARALVEQRRFVHIPLDTIDIIHPQCL